MFFFVGAGLAPVAWGTRKGCPYQPENLFLKDYMILFVIPVGRLEQKL